MDAAVSQPQHQEDVERTLQQGFRLLRFPPALEQAFLQSLYAERTIKLVLAAVISSGLFSSILLTDLLMSDSPIRLGLMLRMGLFAPFVLTTAWLMHRMARPRLTEWLVAPMALVACAIVCLLALVGAQGLVFAKLTELMVIVIYVGVFTRFWPMVAIAVGAMAMQQATAAAIPGLEPGLQQGNTLLMITTLSFSLYASYVREHNARLTYLMGEREQALRASIHQGNQQLQDMARTDALTGVPNRRAFDEAMAQHLAAPPTPAMALLMVDVDHFKAYNDLHGHQAGDRCLCEVASTLSACLRRPMDMLARWGGEEFVVMLSRADEATARQVAERICTAVAERGMAHGRSPTAPVVTVSVGVAMWRATQPVDAEAWLQAADAALYEAKAAGRHRVVMHHDCGGSA